MSAANVSSGNFGENTGGGNYNFPANLGIGASSPETSLDIRSTEFKQMRLWNTGSSQKLWAGSVWDSVGSFIANNAYYQSSYQFIPNYTAASGISFRENGNIEFFADSGLTSGVLYNPSEKVTITTAGNMGIGVSPSERLDVSGSVKINEFRIKRISATSMGVYDSTNTVLLEFDEGV
jgi:hypothetical protein